MLDPLFIEILDSLPQAGGGGSYSGGGGGGSFGGGSGGGDGDGLLYIVFFLIRLAIEHPPVGIPLLFVAGFVGVVGTRRGWFKHQERTIRRSKSKRSSQRSAKVVTRIRQLDESFDQKRFLDRVRVAFRKAQSSWCAQDLEPIRPFVSDGVFERFSLQIEEQKLDRWKQGMTGLSVKRATIVHVEPGVHFDTVTVRISFDAEITRLDLRTGKEIRGSKLPRTNFTECWSFVRRSGAKTVTGDGLIEGMCPNCGATLEMNQSARCGHCECLARSGQFDWVLAEITQSSEWRQEDEASVPGLAQYVERDPGLSLQLLEDRASVAFWRKCASDRHGDSGPLLKVAEAELIERITSKQVFDEYNERRYVGDCAVGSVRTLGVLRGEERDNAIVEIKWDGRRARIDRNSKVELESQRIRRRSLFVFARKTGQATSLDETFTTAHCSSCGAHDTGGTESTCSYCGAPRVGGASTWLLSEIADRHETAAQEWLRKLFAEQRADQERLPPALPASDDLLAWAAAVAHADGQIDKSEIRAIRELAAKMEIPTERADELLQGFSADDAILRPEDDRTGRVWLHELIRMSLADGRIDKSEKKLLGHAARQLSIGERDLEHEFKAARSSLFSESRRSPRQTISAHGS